MDRKRQDFYWLFGKNAVLAAVQNPRRQILELLLTEQHERLLDSLAKLKARNIKPKIVKPEAIRLLVPSDSVHQGIAAKVKILPELTIFPSEILGKTNSTIVICDHIQDPHNFGAILRSCAAFGVDAVVIANKNQATESGTVAKASAGALEIVPIITVANIVFAMNELKKYNYWIAGLDACASDNASKLKDFSKIAIVLGSEGNGMRLLSRKNCDFTVKINMHNAVESLNVAVAAGIVLNVIF